MEITYTLSHEEFTHIQYLMNRHYTVSVMNRSALMALGSFLLSMHSPIHTRLSIALMVFFLFLFIVPLLLKLVVKNVAKKMVNTYPVTCTFKTSKEGISIEKEGQTISFKWTCLKAVEKHKNHIELHFVPLHMIVLFNKVFETELQKRECLNMLEEHSKSSNT